MANIVMWLVGNGRLIAIGLAILFIYSAGWKTHSFIAEAREAELIKKAQQQVIEKQNEWLKKAGEADEKYQFKINALRKRYNDLVRLRANDPNLPCFTPAPSEPNAAPGSNRLPRRSLADLFFYADQQTQQLIALQEWVKSTR